jgi:membrane protein required for colicin V production
LDDNGMTWVDLAILGVMILSGLLAFSRGLVREILSIAAWAGAAVIAFAALPLIRPFLEAHLPSPEWIEPVGYTSVFLVSLIILSIIASAIGSAVRSSRISGLDRSLGLLFGLARGAALAIVAYVAASWVTAPEQWPHAVLDATSLPLICKGAVWGTRQVPERIVFKRVEQCPSWRQTASGGLLKASPTGRAFDPPLSK